MANNRQRKNSAPLAEKVRKTILKRILLPIILLYLLAFSYGFYSIFNIIREIKLHQVEVARNIFDSEIVNIQNVMRMVSVELSVDQHKKIDPALFEGRLHSLFEMDKNGRITRIVYPSALYLEIANIPWQGNGVDKSSFYLIPPYYSSVSGTVVLGMVYRVDVNTSLVAEINLRVLLNSVRVAGKYGYNLFVVDDFGNYVAHPEIERIEKQETLSYECFHKLKTNSLASKVVKLEDEWVIVSVAKSVVADLFYIIKLPLLEAFSPLLKIQGISLVVLLLLLLVLGTSVGIWLYKGIVSPLERFSAFVKTCDTLSPIDKAPGEFFDFSEGIVLEKSFYETLKALRERELRLRESEEKFRKFSELLPVGILVFQEGKITYANKIMETLTGYFLEGFSLQDILLKIVSEKDRSIVANNVRRRMDGSLLEPLQYEISIIHRSGDERIVRIFSNYIELGGKPAIIAGIIDITEIKRMEADRLKLERTIANIQRIESLGTLVSGVAHEFNNILHGVVLSLEMLKKECYGKGIQYFENIEVMTKRASRIVKDILAFARKTEEAEEVVSLLDEVDKVIKLCKQLFPRSINFVVSNNASNDKVLCEKGTIEQIMMNLLKNAKDALESKEEGLIKISLSNEFVAEDTAVMKKGCYVVITVEDNGHGMSKDIINKIFDPFFTTKPVGKGSGLGLFTVYGIVKSLGGAVLCESELGQGTTFKVYLPVAKSLLREKEVASFQDRGSKELAGNVKVLIVEDEDIAGKLIKTFLEREGFEAEVAKDPSEALDKLKSSKDYNVIITDLGLPGIGGRGLIREIRKSDAKVPIIVMSGYSTIKPLEEELNRLGVNIFIPKPFSTDDLKEAIAKIISSQ